MAFKRDGLEKLGWAQFRNNDAALKNEVLRESEDGACVEG